MVRPWHGGQGLLVAGLAMSALVTYASAGVLVHHPRRLLARSHDMPGKHASRLTHFMQKVWLRLLARLVGALHIYKQVFQGWSQMWQWVRS